MKGAPPARWSGFSPKVHQQHSNATNNNSKPAQRTWLLAEKQQTNHSGECDFQFVQNNRLGKVSAVKRSDECNIAKDLGDTGCYTIAKKSQWHLWPAVAEHQKCGYRYRKQEVK